MCTRMQRPHGLLRKPLLCKLSCVQSYYPLMQWTVVGVLFVLQKILAGMSFLRTRSRSIVKLSHCRILLLIARTVNSIIAQALG